MKMRIKNLGEYPKTKKSIDRIDENQKSLKDMLSILFRVIERFEKNRKIVGKSDREKMAVLKNMISGFIKDEDQKQIIRGGV